MLCAGSDGWAVSTTKAAVSDWPRLAITLLGRLASCHRCLRNLLAPIVPNIAVGPTSRDFGEVLSGQSVSQQFTVTNTGDGDLNIHNVTIVGEGFAITADTAQTTLGGVFALVSSLC